MHESGGEASPASVPSPRPEAPCSAARQAGRHWPGGTRGSGGGDAGCAETPRCSSSVSVSSVRSGRSTGHSAACRQGHALRPAGTQGMPAAVTGTWGVLPGRGWRPRLPELPFVTRAAFLFSVVPGPEMGAAQMAWPCDGREGPRVPRQTRPRFGSSSWGAASSPAAAGTLSLFAAAPGPGSELRGSLAASTQMSPKFPKTCVIIRPFEQNRAVDRCLELGWGLLPPFPSVY